MVKSHLESKVRGSRIYDPEEIARRVKRSKESTKHCFDGRSTKYYLQFGTTRDAKLEFGISRDRLKLHTYGIEETFPSP